MKGVKYYFLDFAHIGHLDKKLSHENHQVWGYWLIFFGDEVCDFPGKNKGVSLDFHLIASYCFAVKALHLDIFIRLFIVILANMRQKMFLVTGTSLKRLLMDAQKLLRASHSQLWGSQYNTQHGILKKGWMKHNRLYFQMSKGRAENDLSSRKIF